MNEQSLYAPCRVWLSQFLRRRMPKADITVLGNSDRRGLKHSLAEADLSSAFPVSSAWDVMVDVAAVVRTRSRTSLAFVELKVKPIRLVDVGQLLGYCRVCHPVDAFLLSPGGVSGDLSQLLRVYGRTDILAYDRTSIHVGTWDMRTGEPDWSTMIPSGQLAHL